MSRVESRRESESQNENILGSDTLSMLRDYYERDTKVISLLSDHEEILEKGYGISPFLCSAHQY